MDDAPSMRLYRALACPYSHRAELVLAAKGHTVEKVEIDLLDRPSWFMDRASQGRIPLLEIDDAVVPFADRVCEFLDERFPDPPLNAGTPEQRAEARRWVDWCTSTLGPVYEAALMHLDPADTAARFDALVPVVATLEERLVARAAAGVPGPYFHGASPGWVDLTYATIAVRFAGLERFHGWTVPDRFGSVRAWFAVLCDDPLVQSTSDVEGIIAMIGYYREVLSGRPATPPASLPPYAIDAPAPLVVSA